MDMLPISGVCFEGPEGKGTKIFNGYLWHGFSFRIEEAVEGAEAELAYEEQPEAPFVIFDEDGEFCLR
jgi:hypothetical protein